LAKATTKANKGNADEKDETEENDKLRGVGVIRANRKKAALRCAAGRPQTGIRRTTASVIGKAGLYSLAHEKARRGERPC
jgi:hypothetical protein